MCTILALVSCSTDIEGSDKVSTLGEVQDLLAETSYPCTNWDERDDTLATCDMNGGWATVFLSETPSALALSISDDETSTTGFAVGGNWLVGCHGFGLDCQLLADELGVFYQSV